jgi:hypothetical protein
MRYGMNATDMDLPYLEFLPGMKEGNMPGMGGSNIARSPYSESAAAERKAKSAAAKSKEAQSMVRGSGRGHGSFEDSGHAGFLKGGGWDVQSEMKYGGDSRQMASDEKATELSAAYAAKARRESDEAKRLREQEARAAAEDRGASAHLDQFERQAGLAEDRQGQWDSDFLRPDTPEYEDYLRRNNQGY